MPQRRSRSSRRSRASGDRRSATARSRRTRRFGNSVDTRDWKSFVADAQYVPEVVRPEMPDVVRRALAAGATPPLEYMGAGMTGVVFCEGDRVAYKVGRRTSPILRRMLGDEAEWLKAAGRVPGVREHVADFRRYDPENVVIVRSCPQGDPDMSVYRYGEHRLSELHSAIERLMIPHGWTAPEFKGDSYVLTRSGPVLVDASMPARVGHVLLAYVRDILSGKRETDETLSTLAFEIRREIGQTLTKAEAQPVLAALAARGVTE